MRSRSNGSLHLDAQHRLVRFQAGSTSFVADEERVEEEVVDWGVFGVGIPVGLL